MPQLLTLNTLYNLPLPIKQHESSPITFNTVVEYRERNLRPFLFTETLQIIQSPRSSLVHSPFQLSPQGLGQGLR